MFFHFLNEYFKGIGRYQKVFSSETVFKVYHEDLKKLDSFLDIGSNFVKL